MPDDSKVVVLDGGREAFDYHVKIDVYVNVETGAVRAVGSTTMADQADFKRLVFGRILDIFDAEEHAIERDESEDVRLAEKFKHLNLKQRQELFGKQGPFI